jgi:hypothetical protein
MAPAGMIAPAGMRGNMVAIAAARMSGRLRRGAVVDVIDDCRIVHPPWSI